MQNRIARIERNTNETRIALTLNLDGTGECACQTGIGFFDHMLSGFARHGLFDQPRRQEIDRHPRAADGRPLGASIDLNIMSGNGTDLVVKEGRCDTVFRYVGENSLEAAYRLDAGKYTLPAEAYGTSPKVVKDKYCVIADIWEGERYLLVPVYNYAADGREEFLIFDRGEPSRRFSAVGPGRQRGIFLDGIAFKPMYIRGNRLVGYMQAPDIAAGSGDITDPGLKTLAATIKSNGNPVIVMATLKK